ncbi:HNH endonuclease [Streptomyces sp. NPDC088551]|uniref:HNH endonuclease n=1 Tax=Streptomyces sp. NPDC088551 TaxID=3365863 RepID=UPI003808B6B9
MATWLVLAKSESKRVGEGYDDEPSTHYSWDDTVANSGALKAGDVIALWDSKTLLGLSVIEAIDVGKGEKNTPYCPYCRKADVAPRKTMTPVYKCWNKPCGKEFDQPGWTHKKVTTYRSRHEAGWTDARGTLTAPELRALCVHPNSQLSLRELRADDFHHALTHGGTPFPLRVIDNTQEMIAGGHSKRMVRARKGQATFRKAQLDIFGEMCAFSGPVPAQALEAAHLYSYAANSKHHKFGGLLLRRDLHRLFDLGLIAVNPTSQKLDVSSDLTAFPQYTQWHGQPITVQLTASHLKWLTMHWDLHRPSPRPAIPTQNTNTRPATV